MTTHNEEVARVRSLRAAFMDGALALHHCYFSGDGTRLPLSVENLIRDKGTIGFPMPTVEVPRVVKDPDSPAHEWCFVGGHFLFRVEGDSQWDQQPLSGVSAQRVAMWADLIANPTERRQVDE